MGAGRPHGAAVRLGMKRSTLQFRAQAEDPALASDAPPRDASLGLPTCWHDAHPLAAGPGTVAQRWATAPSVLSPALPAPAGLKTLAQGLLFLWVWQALRHRVPAKTLSGGGKRPGGLTHKRLERFKRGPCHSCVSRTPCMSDCAGHGNAWRQASFVRKRRWTMLRLPSMILWPPAPRTQPLAGAWSVVGTVLAHRQASYPPTTLVDLTSVTFIDRWAVSPAVDAPRPCERRDVKMWHDLRAHHRCAGERLSDHGCCEGENSRHRAFIERSAGRAPGEPCARDGCRCRRALPTRAGAGQCICQRGTRRIRHASCRHCRRFGRSWRVEVVLEAGTQSGRANADSRPPWRGSTPTLRTAWCDTRRADGRKGAGYRRIIND